MYSLGALASVWAPMRNTSDGVSLAQVRLTGNDLDGIRLDGISLGGINPRLGII